MISSVNNERMKRWNGIEMGFRKRDEKAQERRNIRANEIAMDYAQKKGVTPTVMMASELHTIGKPIAMACSTCINEGLEGDETFLMIHHKTNPMEEEGWFDNPILDVICRRGHKGHIKLNSILHTEKWPVHLLFGNGGIAWVEGGIQIANLEFLRECGNWPYDDDETPAGMVN